MIKIKSIGLFILPALFVALTTGCDNDTPNIETVDSAPNPSEVEPVDLAPVPDLFAEPIQPNPLALSAEDVVITVDGEEITHGAIMQAAQMRMVQMSRQVPQDQLAQLYPKVYQEMSAMLVANILLTKAAEKSSLVINDDVLAEEIAQIETNIPEGKTLQDMLDENKIDWVEWKENLRKQLLVGKLVEEKTDQTTEPTADEVSEFYQENIESFKMPEAVSASHILMAFTEEDTDETKAEKKANLAKLREEIVAGGSFEELAVEYSDCPSSQNNGSLGAFGRGQMVPEFEAAAFGLATHEISEIVETQFGYHLIKVSEHQGAGIQVLADVEEQLQAYLATQKKQEVLVSYIEELKEKADITTYGPNFDAATQE